MGLKNSKETTLHNHKSKEKEEKYLGELKENMREGKGTYIEKDGHRYEGDWHNDMRHGKGTYYLKNGELYIGDWAKDMKNGFGKYFYQNGERYIGEWKQNLKEGKGVYHYTNGSYYEGIFHDDHKNGPGHLHNPDGTIEDQFHEYNPENPMESSNEISEKRISLTKAEESKDIPLSSKIENEIKNPDLIMETGSEPEKSKNNMMTTESMDEKMQFSEFKSDLKTLDIGLETLSLIDQIEMMNSLNSSLLNKNLQDWTIDEVGEWMNNLGLVDYIDTFKNNHISGKNLLDITDKELKDELGMVSVGHRKNFSKSQEHLKKIYSKNKIFNQAIRLKLKKFYEKHKNNLRSNLHHQNQSSPQTHSFRFNSIINSINSEIIEEDQNDQASLKEEITIEKINNAAHKKPSYDNYADDENENEDIFKPEKETGSALSKKNRNKKQVESSQLLDYEAKPEASTRITNTNDQEGNTTNNNKVSESESSSESSSSSDDDNINGNGKKQKKEKVCSPDRQNMIIHNKKQPDKTKKQQQYSSSLDKNFVLKTLKEVGIGINFLLDPQELEIQQKIGEGGYGDVYYGKWLGQDVAIKHFGKRYSKFQKRRLADFIKEVEVISNLRHPNILLYMGVCINCPKFDCPNYLMLTEYLEGGSLFDLLHKKHVKLNEERLICIAEDIALGMNYLHSRKVFHCDLKSSNILVDSNWNIKICDFGLSTVKSKLDRRKHKKEGRIGTPHWMAPEIMRSENYDEFSDIYSYGMILWEMVSGEVPYNGLSVPQIIGSVGYDKLQVPLPKQGNSMILKIMEKSLDKDRTKRPTFNQIVEVLQNKNRGKENKKYVISELKKFFNE